MIQKVLIAEDHESVNISLQKTLDELSIKCVDHVYYCDDALQQIEKNAKNAQPYDLLITDLHFDVDHRIQQIAGGMALISAVKKVQPGIKILVFSAESKLSTIKMLYNVYEIDGFVRKARHDAEELKIAISEITHNRRYITQQLAQNMRQLHAYHLEEYDRTIISLLAEGYAQKNIPYYLKKNNIEPSGLSSVEKRLKYIRETLQFQKNEQLVAFCKDMGIL